MQVGHWLHVEHPFCCQSCFFIRQTAAISSFRVHEEENGKAVAKETSS
ncbi:hypothetical protein I656_03115 [Geobacillus sp. WSUCF1]|nr:hypothetical protein I656_03115 [Geobacillus sp. WSUCF1]